MLTVAQVYALADTVSPRYRALVLPAVFGSLRWGELAVLRRSDVDIQADTVRVARQLSEPRGGGFAFGPPKSNAGKRAVAVPEVITADLATRRTALSRTNTAHPKSTPSMSAAGVMSGRRSMRNELPRPRREAMAGTSSAI